MNFQCGGCESSFREKKNLQQHMRKRHGFKKYKCDHCNFHSDDRSNVVRHEKTTHGNEIYNCDQCDFKCKRKDHLYRHIRNKHLEKNIRCEECEFVTDRKGVLKRHIHAKHTLKKCNECDYTSLSQLDIKKHKNNQHAPDNATVESAFNKTLYNKTWKVRGNKDPLDVLGIYKPKIRNEIRDYIDEKEAVKWYIGMKVKMVKTDKDGEKYEEAYPGFTSNHKISGTLLNFDSEYSTNQEKIVNDFVEFNANGSGWILERVNSVSLHMVQYTTGRATTTTTSTDDSDDELLDENGYAPTPDFF